MAHQKFMFDRSFDVEEPVAEASDENTLSDVEEEPEIVLPTFSEEEMETARKNGFEEGKEAALREAADAIENQIIDAIKAISEQLDQLIKNQLLANSDIFRDSIKVSQAITTKSFPSLNKEQGFSEIENVIRQILPQILEEPRVVINVHPNINEQLAQRIEQISTETHFEGRIKITGDESIEEGDCRIEWSNGGAERNLEHIMLEIDAIIETNLATSDDEYVPSPDALDESPIDQLHPDQSPRSESHAEISTDSAIVNDGTSAPESSDMEPNEAQNPPENNTQVPDSAPEPVELETTDFTDIAQEPANKANSKLDDVENEAPSLQEPPHELEIKPEDEYETNPSEGV